MHSKEELPLIRHSSRRNMFVAAFSASLYVVLFGMVTGYAAPATADMARPGSRFQSVITPQQIAWIASAPSLSGILGNIVAGYASHRLGRRAVLIYISVSFTISWLIVAYAPRLSLVLMGRLVSGFCAGICSVAVPAYIVEISTVQTRGLLSSSFQLSFAVGVFVEMTLGIFLRWSWLAVCGAVVVVIGAILMVFMPESPPWLVRMSKNNEAKQAIRFLKGDAAEEFREMYEGLTEESRRRMAFKDLFRPEMYKPLAISVSLMFFQQFAGINALMAYSVEIFQASKNFLDPVVGATLVALVQILATVLSGSMMDKKGRRVLFMTSGVCMTSSLVVAGVHSRLSQTSDLAAWSWVPLCTFVTYMVGFALGFGPIPFVVTPELVPLHSRSFLLSAASVSNSCFSFVVIKTFDDLRELMGLAGVYWTYAAFTFLGVLFYWKWVPETKGRSICDIHRSFLLCENSS